MLYFGRVGSSWGIAHFLVVHGGKGNYPKKKRVASVAQMGGRPPHFCTRGWLQPPPWPIWGGRTTPLGFYNPQKAKKPKNQKKQKNKTSGFWGVAEPPLDRAYGVVKTTPRPLGVVQPPAKPKPFLVFWPFRSGRVILKADWSGSSTPDRPRGWLPLAKYGVVGHPFGQRLLPHLFFF
jgi:hypothetical protein